MRKINFTNSNNESIDFSSYESFVIKKFEQSCGVNIYSSKNISQDGNTYQGNTLNTNEITLEIAILASNESELINYRMLINKVFNPKLEEGYLYYKDSINERKIKCIVSKLPFYSITNSISGTYLINLTANDPYWKDININKINIAEWIGDFHFPLTISASSMGHRVPNLIVNAGNNGDVETGLIVDFIAKGTVVNPSVFNVNTREYFKINTTMVAGETIRVNTNYNEKGVTRILDGVETNIMHLIDITSTFLQLSKGDNLFRYDADQNLDNLSISAYYENKYMGV